MTELAELLKWSPLPRGAAFDLCSRLGRLARSVVRPDVIDLAGIEDPILLAHCCGQDHPPLPTEPGSCWVLFVRTALYPNLRPAFALPLRWRSGERDDPRLPGSLRELAARVRAMAKLPDWGLGYADGVGGTPDLSGLEVRADSGWVPVYGGLRLAADELQPNPDVWASGTWDDGRGILPVGEVVDKAALAREFGASQLFVPAGQEDEVTVAGLKAGVLGRLGGPRLEALDEYLLAVGAPPAAPAPADPDDDRLAALQRCWAYWARLPPDRAVTYYQSHSAGRSRFIARHILPLW